MCAPRPNVSRQVAKNSLVRNTQDLGIPRMRSKEKALALCSPTLQPPAELSHTQVLPLKLFKLTWN